MKYNELIITKQKKNTRVGRGISAGRGKTAGRGTKGQGARKSGGVRPGFEGGQTPLHMRLPKMRGFRSLQVKNDVIYTGQLDQIKKATIDNETLHAAGLVSSPHTVVKLLLKGDLTTKKEVKLQAASAKALEAVNGAGGSFTQVSQIGRPVTKKTTKQ